MSLADAIQKERPKRSGHRMRAESILDELSKADAEAFVAALNDPTLSPRKLSRAMTANGSPISYGAISNWRVTHGVE